MNIFPKKSIKKLNLQEMWQVYGFLQSGLTQTSEKYLLHEILKILDNISTESFKDALRVMSISDSKDPLATTISFVKSIKKNQFFSFVQLVKSIHGNR